MKTPNPLTAIRRQMKRFRAEILADREVALTRGLHISGIFIDRKDAAHRIIVLCHTDSDVAVVEAVVKEYFGAHPHKIKYYDERPAATLNAGSAIADTTGGFGTVGGFFTRGDMGSQVYGLSNNHVLAGCNAQPIGSSIVDTNGQQLGKLSAYIKLLPPPNINSIDAAIFALDPGVEGVWQPFKPQGICNERMGLQVMKVGANSAFPTNGSITNITLNEGHLEVKLLGNFYWFSPVFAIKGQSGFFSAPGDSGALVFTPSGLLVGLLFAILGEFSYATPIRKLGPLGLEF